MILGIGPVETTFGVVDRQAVRQAEIFLNKYGSIGAVHEAAFDFLGTPMCLNQQYLLCALSQKLKALETRTAKQSYHIGKSTQGSTLGGFKNNVLWISTYYTTRPS